MGNKILAVNAKGREKSFTQMQWDNMPEGHYGWTAAGGETVAPKPEATESKVPLPEKVSIKAEVPPEVLNPPTVKEPVKTAPKAKAKRKSKK